MIDNVSTTPTIPEITQQLQEHGGVTLSLGGKELFLVLNRNLGRPEKGILVAYEGGGAMFFNLDRPLNAFRLSARGFPLIVAQLVTQLMNELLNQTVEAGQHRTMNEMRLLTHEGT